MLKLDTLSQVDLMRKRGGHYRVVRSSQKDFTVYSEDKLQIKTKSNTHATRNVMAIAGRFLHDTKELALTFFKKNLASTRVDCFQLRLVSSLSTSSFYAASSRLDP